MSATNHNSSEHLKLQDNSAIEGRTRVLILLYPRFFYLGDSVKLFSKLRLAYDFFGRCTIDINYDRRFAAYGDLLEGNPFVNSFHDMPIADLKLDTYDVIMILHEDESAIRYLLNSKHAGQIAKNEFRPRIYSMSSYMIVGPKTVYPAYEELYAHKLTSQVHNNMTHELFMSDQEIEWGNDWLREQGVQEHEKVLVMIDETNRAAKLLKLDVYFSIVEQLLRDPAYKVLIFDFKELGKDKFYEAWLGPQHSSRMLFANGQNLRNTLCVLSSQSIKMVFGPCTGLLHCAAAIRTCLSGKGVNTSMLPKLIVYTGQYPSHEGSAFTWWNNSGVNCWMVERTPDGKKRIVSLEGLNEEQLAAIDVLPCSEYEAQMMLDSLKPLLV